MDRTIELDLGFNNKDWNIIKDALAEYQKITSDADLNEDIGTIYDTIDRCQKEVNEVLDNINVDTAISVVKQNMEDMGIDTANLEILESFIDDYTDPVIKNIIDRNWSKKFINETINKFLDEYEDNDPKLVDTIVDKVEEIENEIFG